MTPEAQRIAIAEACGWIYVGSDSTTKWYLSPEWAPLYACRHSANVWRDIEKRRSQLPDYLNDLNAMHEAEKQLTAGQARTYDKELQKIGYRERMAGAFWLWHFPPQWKAEAFLRTIGKWVD